MDKTHSDVNAKCRAIIDDAMAELLMLGMESRSDAATLMAIQSIIRIDDQGKIKSVAEFAASCIVDED